MEAFVPFMTVDAQLASGRPREVIEKVVTVAPSALACSGPVVSKPSCPISRPLVAATSDTSTLTSKIQPCKKHRANQETSRTMTDPQAQGQPANAGQYQQRFT
jgi:hypothetical protein